MRVRCLAASGLGGKVGQRLARVAVSGVDDRGPVPGVEHAVLLQCRAKAEVGRRPLAPRLRQAAQQQAVQQHRDDAGRQRIALQAQPGRLGADIDGFSLLAAVRCGADDRVALEQLCRYITRPGLANERVQTNAAGQVVLKLKAAWPDGTTHLVMSPLESRQRLAALVPRPRLHLIRLVSA